MEQNKAQESKKPTRRKRKSFKHTKTGKYHSQDGGGGKGFKYGWPKPLPGGSTTEARAQCSPSTSDPQNIEEGLVSVPSVDPQSGVPGSAMCTGNSEEAISLIEVATASPTSNTETSCQPTEEVAESTLYNFTTCITPAATTMPSGCEDHSYSSHPRPDCVPTGNQSQLLISVSTEIISMINDSLPRHWLCVRKDTGINIFLMSRLEETAIQRRICISPDGTMTFSVHRKPVSDGLFKSVSAASGPSVILNGENSSDFLQWVLRVVNTVRRYEICEGVLEPKFKPLWTIERSGEIDRNAYGEVRYTETFRSKECELLIDSNKRRCHPCRTTQQYLSKKLVTHQSPDFHPSTRNEVLDEAQKLHKMTIQQKTISNIRQQLRRARISQCLEEEGVELDEELSNFLRDGLAEKMTEIQKLFLEQMVKRATLKKTTSMRWHPSIIKFALLLKSTSSAAYRAVQQSGVISLPSERCLYDYSHAMPKTQGCNEERIHRIWKKIEKCEHYQKYFVLMMDEMHVNKKLVYQKSTGELIGYVDLSEAETEIAELEKAIDSEDRPTESAHLATKMLTYMVKGVANGIKQVVASFTTDVLTKEQLYQRTWNVIGTLERMGLMVSVVVCDGSAVNRAFIAMHVPITKLASGVIFDTTNRFAPCRVLFFMSDPPHLIKTIRNCFSKSGHGQHCTRLMTRNDEFIVWSVIIKLYEEERHDILRRAHKLNREHVFLTSFSCMNVRLAAQALSKTVAELLASKNWKGTGETVNFILRWNNFFDCVNGATSGGMGADGRPIYDQAKRTANTRLAPYENVEDKRFDELMDCVKYLEDWEAEVQKKTTFTEAERERMLLSRQTREGIEMTARAFVGATKFLLEEGVKYVNGRVFCQDPMEQYFSKQRQSCGGSRNPTTAQFQSNDQAIDVHQDVNVRSSGNTTAVTRAISVSDEPLAKRRTP